jgi:hypothetical protein
MTQATYGNGDAITARVFRFANGNVKPAQFELKIWLGAPGIPPISFVNAGANGSLSLPAGFDRDLGPLHLFTVSAAVPRGAYEFSCRTLNPVTGRLLSEDLNTFTIQ